MPIIISAIAGILIWMLVSVTSGKAEAWDSQWYWITGYPLLIFFCFGLGWFFPERAWSYGIVSMFVQVLPMLVMGGDLSLLPIGLIFLGLLSVPLSLSGVVGSRAKSKYV